jgi:alanyl-tRNA synthetase
MRTDKDLKKELKIKAANEPDRFYATKVLREAGFHRNTCSKCGVNFWSTDASRTVCGDSACSGGFAFFKNSPVTRKMDYIRVWQEFAKMFKGLGYTPIPRYPVVSRWNPTMEYTIASIAAFQPFVISGEVEPPANPLVIPQFCLRFGDIDNVGYTGSHMTGFVMIGQHMFVPPERWDQDKAFRDIKKWLNDGLGLPDSEIIFHEDAWAGGGNAGVCMEFFSRGVELGNQVYMLYEQTPDDKLVDLKLKVLDMGMGHERNAWFSQGTCTIYEATFPTVIERLLKKTGVIYDHEFMERYAPHAGKLNIDETPDIKKAWKEVAHSVGMTEKELRERITPLAGIFSIAEHMRAILFALNDGALPSNVGGGYNLRVLIRRSLSFIDKYGWDIRLPEVCRWHAEYLKPLFPELMENLDNIERILNVELQKYQQGKEKIQQVVASIVKKDTTEEILLQLYDSNGISPEMVREEAAKQGKKVPIPDNFFAKVAALHEKKEQVHATHREHKLDLDGVPETKANYFEDYSRTDFTATVQKIIGKNVILDQTLFYPTSGGQLHDIGSIDGIEVTDIFKQGAIVVHVLKSEASFNEGASVKGSVDLDRRKQLSQHHTAAHIVNAAAKRVLGSHVNQAGAKKTVDKAHLDIAHYQAVSEYELKEIERVANEMVTSDLPIKKNFFPRREAEDKYGMQIYQGGAVPGKMVRIVEIPGIDVEACGGTHLNRTGEVGTIKLEKATKIQDGIVRLTFTAGNAAKVSATSSSSVLEEAALLLGVRPDQVPGRSEEVFRVWKEAVKAKKKSIAYEVKYESRAAYKGDALAESARVLRTQPENVAKTLRRFLLEIRKNSQK